MFNSFPPHLDVDDAAPSDETGDVTVRPAAPEDADALRRLTELEGRDAGAEPHLVAERDGTVVASLSIGDGSALGDPFQRTESVFDLLRAHAVRRSTPGAGPARRVRGRRIRVALGGALAALSLAAVGLVTGAEAGQAAPKPGFVPGTWIGKGTISGRTADAVAVTTFTGALSFRLKVDRSGRISGTGTWSRTMTGSGRMAATIVAKANVQVAGTPTAVRLTGTYRAVGTFSADGVTRTSTFAPATLNEALRITRAGTCRVTGRHTYRGVTTTWSAQLAGSGTCRT